MKYRHLEEPMGEITYERLHDFVLKRGDIRILDLTGKTTMVGPDTPDVFDLIAKANRFSFEEHWYTREDFAKLLDSALSADG
jgi:hypothetical protein